MNVRGLLLVGLLLGAPMSLAAAKPDAALFVALERAEDLRLVADPAFERAVASPNANLRERAALAMGRLQAPEHGLALISLALGDSVKAVRHAAIFALGQLGLAEGAQPGEAVVNAVLGLLKGPDPEQRDAEQPDPELPDPELRVLAVEALGKLAATEAVDPLIACLTDADPRLRAEAALALFRLRFVPVWRRQADSPPELPSGAREALLHAFFDPEPEVRRAAVYAFARFGDPEAAKALLPMISDADELTRLFAARALGKSGKPGAAPAFRSRANEPSAAVRAELALALATLGRAQLLAPAWVDDPSFHVRAAVARALGSLDTEESLGALRKLEADSSPTVRGAAIEALAKRLQAAYVPVLAEKLGARSWTDRVAAARGAGAIGAVGLDLLGRASTDPDARVATAAIEGLGELEDPRAETFLTTALGSPDLGVRGAAVAAVGGRESMPRAQLLTAVYDASAGEDWVEVREGVAEALGEARGGAMVLQRIAAKDPAPSVRSRAAAALAKLGIQFPLPPAAAGKPSPFLDRRLGRRLAKNPVVVMETSKGRLEIECFAEETPIHCANFVALVKKGYYNGLLWHRVVPNFVVQGGDPRGDGSGGPGYSLRDEISRRRYQAGSVGMPKGGKDTGGGQLFITHLPTPHLDGNYTLFGQVTTGLEVVEKLEVGDQIVKATLKR